LSEQEKKFSQVSLDGVGPTSRRAVWGRKNEEYLADFINIARRSLTEQEFRLFRMHFLLGGDWRFCTARLGLNRGEFFHAVYRVEQKLGRAYRETEPYALYPFHDYFYATGRARAAAAPAHVPVVVPLRPPTKPVAPQGPPGVQLKAA
jgi:hypothetical protein